MRALARGDLPLTDLRDRVDYDDEVAWLEFRLHGRPFHWDLEFNDDWVDAALFRNFAGLLEKADTSRRFTYHDLGRQDCLIGCSTSEQLSMIRKRTGLKFEWLS